MRHRGNRVTLVPRRPASETTANILAQATAYEFLVSAASVQPRLRPPLSFSRPAMTMSTDPAPPRASQRRSSRSRSPVPPRPAELRPITVDGRDYSKATLNRMIRIEQLLERVDRRMEHDEQVMLTPCCAGSRRWRLGTDKRQP